MKNKIETTINKYLNEDNNLYFLTNGNKTLDIDGKFRQNCPRDEIEYFDSEQEASKTKIMKFKNDSNIKISKI